jgi:hypothetical protein
MGVSVGGDWQQLMGFIQPCAFHGHDTVVIHCKYLVRDDDHAQHPICTYCGRVGRDRSALSSMLVGWVAGAVGAETITVLTEDRTKHASD